MICKPQLNCYRKKKPESTLFLVWTLPQKNGGAESTTIRRNSIEQLTIFKGLAEV